MPKSPEEALVYWDKSHVQWDNRKEVRAAVLYIIEVAKIRGWDTGE